MPFAPALATRVTESHHRLQLAIMESDTGHEVGGAGRPRQASTGSMPRGMGRLLHPLYPKPEFKNYSVIDAYPNELVPVNHIQRDTADDWGWQCYHGLLRSAFAAIEAGRVKTARTKMLVASRWLVDAVPRLGLQYDDESRHPERLQLWTELNLCWEALGQKQKEIAQETRRTGTGTVSGQGLSRAAVIHLINELVNLGDKLAPYGLVDFEMGIWEEQIVHIFMACLDLWPR
ncbi:uncharacterized protein PV07_12818 [Cladophialophora immunda]|uniref:Uncharacterized protein n=1 Tax=Cladophialophora immunda TaxID=569365 RepID=A0A0D2AAE8_9EURO|nr:uncharacterized protein PV07_12818 [Cladophialophora immunda]KIW21752.1 hypothetical protein PV07_12818 [Cladophialophora immunda]